MKKLKNAHDETFNASLQNTTVKTTKMQSYLLSSSLLHPL